MSFSVESGYNAFENLHVQSIFPMVSGFQNQVVFGLFTRISDPLLINDIYLSVGVSPLSEKQSYPLWHIKFKYD